MSEMPDTSNIFLTFLTFEARGLSISREDFRSMEQLLSIAHINDTELKSILSRIQGEELLRLSEPCYYPNLIKFNLQLMHATGLTKQDIDDFVERTWRGRPKRKKS